MFFLRCGLREGKLGCPPWASPGLVQLLRPVRESCWTAAWLFHKEFVFQGSVCGCCEHQPCACQCRADKANTTEPIEAALASWMGNRLGLIKFHQKDFIPGSGTGLGRGFKLARPCVSVSHPAEQEWHLSSRGKDIEAFGWKSSCEARVWRCSCADTRSWLLGPEPAVHVKSLWRQQDLNVGWSLSVHGNALQMQVFVTNNT